MALSVASLSGGFGQTDSRIQQPALAHNQAAGEVPFRLVSGYLIVVDGSIGRLDRLRFIVDTGANRSVIDQGIARTLGLGGASTDMYAFADRVATEEVVAPSLAFGPVRGLKIPVLTADFQPLESRFGFRPDALVGVDVLGERCFTIDYVASSITFECVRGWPAEVAFDPRSPYPVVEALIDGARYRLIVDSGAEAIAIYERAIPAGHPIKVDAEVEALHLTGTQRLKRFTSSHFKIGEHALGRPPVFIMSSADDIPGYDGVLGTRWLGTRVYFDFARQLLGWR